MQISNELFTDKAILTQYAQNYEKSGGAKNKDGVDNFAKEGTFTQKYKKAVKEQHADRPEKSTPKLKDNSAAYACAQAAGSAQTDAANVAEAAPEAETAETTVVAQVTENADGGSAQVTVPAAVDLESADDGILEGFVLPMNEEIIPAQDKAATQTAAAKDDTPVDVLNVQNLARMPEKIENTEIPSELFGNIRELFLKHPRSLENTNANLDTYEGEEMATDAALFVESSQETQTQPEQTLFMTEESEGDAPATHETGVEEPVVGDIPAAQSGQEGSQAALNAAFNQALTGQTQEVAPPGTQINASQLERGLLTQMVTGFDAAMESETKAVRIQMNPDFLGSLVIELSMNAEGLTAKLKTNDLIAKGLIAGQLGDMEATLRDRGIKVSQLDVTYEAADRHDLADQNTNSYADGRQGYAEQFSRQGYAQNARLARVEMDADGVPLPAESLAAAAQSEETVAAQDAIGAVIYQKDGTIDIMI